MTRPSRAVFATAIAEQLTDRPSITAAVGAGIEKLGAIDALLNNAGYGAYGLLEAAPMEKIERVFATNVLGLLETTKAVLPHFRARRSGAALFEERDERRGD